MQEQLAALQKERDELGQECNRLHVEHSDALKEIESLKEQLGSKTSEPTLSPNFSDFNEVRDQVLKKWKLIKGAESIDRIRKALDTFIRILETNK